jgi:hypothetical protein
MVIYMPDVNNNTVFNKGNENGFIGTIPFGGHTPPIQILGDKLK